MIYFLDTNICIYFLTDQYHSIREKLRTIPQKQIKLPAVVAAELFYGASKSRKREHNLEQYSQFMGLYEVIPFDHSASRRYGDIRSSLELIGQTIGGNDLMIAASALSCGAVLVTNNTKEFSRMDNLVIEDWTLSS